MGWMGSESQLMAALHENKVDQDEEGMFKVDGEIVSFMGAGEEFVVGDDAVAYIEGKPHNLCTMLEKTGMKVKVI
jgi:hypothetical protein